MADRRAEPRGARALAVAPSGAQARLVRRLGRGGAKVIALDILLSEPEVSGELRAVEQVVRAASARSESRPGRRHGRSARELASSREADRDGQLEAAIRNSGRVGAAGRLRSSPRPFRPPCPSPRARRSSRRMSRFRHYPERASLSAALRQRSRGADPAARRTAAQASLGHVTMVADHDGTTRWEALVFEHRGYYYPSLGVQAGRLARAWTRPRSSWTSAEPSRSARSRSRWIRATGC